MCPLDTRQKRSFCSLAGGQACSLGELRVPEEGGELVGDLPSGVAGVEGCGQLLGGYGGIGGDVVDCLGALGCGERSVPVVVEERPAVAYLQ